MIRIRELDSSERYYLEEVCKNWLEYVDIAENGFELDVTIHDTVPLVLTHYNSAGTRGIFFQVGERIMSIDRNQYEKIEIF